MKHGWCETINDTVLCHRTPFNVAVILDQLSSFNNMLREMIREEKTFDLRLSATAKEHVPNGLDNKNVNNDGKAIEEKKEENFIFPKNMLIDYFA